MNAFSAVEKFDFDFAVKFVKASEAGNGDNIFGIAQTGDALGIVITVLLALIAIGSFAAYFVRKHNFEASMGTARPSVSGKHSAVSSASAKKLPFSTRILLTIGCVAALASCLYTFLPMVSPAWAAYVNLPAVSVPVSDDGSTPDVSIHLKNTRDYPVRLNSFSSVLYGDSYTKEDNWTITTKVDGLDNQLYNDISDGHIEKLDYIKDYLLPGELIDLKIKVNTTPEQALGLVGQIFEADTLNMQDARVDVPEINDELVYNGKWQCPIEDFDIDNPAYTIKNTKTDTEAETSATTMKDGFAKDVNFDTETGAAYDENYFTTITLNNGYVWEDGTTDPIECKWKITKAPLTVTTGSATQVYNNTYLTCDDITIDGLCSDEDGIVEIFDDQYAPKCPDGYMATGGMTSSPIPAEDAEPSDFVKYFKDVDVIDNTYRIWWGDPEESTSDTHYAWENNYSITENLGTLEITKTDMIYFAPSQEYTYNGEAQGKPVETYPLNSDDYGTEGVPKETDDTRYIHFYYKTADDTDFKEYDYYGKDEDPRTDCPTITDVAESTTIEYKIESRNYHTVTGTYDLTINPLDAQLTWTPWAATNDFTKVYDKVNEFPACSLSNIVTGDDTTVDVQVESVQLGKGFVTETIDADIYMATAIGLSGADASNYNLIGVSGTTQQYTITPKEVTLTWDATTTFVYDGDAHVINATVKSTDVTSGDSVNVTDYDLAANAPAALKYGEAIDAGSYTRTATALDNANYIIKAGDTSVSCDFLINAKEVSVTWDASGAAYTYNGEIQHPNAIIHGLVKDEYVIASTYKYVSSGEDVDSVNVGEYTIYPEDLTFENGTPATNYVLPELPRTECQVTYSIKPKTVSLDWSFNDKEIVYDGVAHNATAQINDIVAGDTVNATYAYACDSASVADCINAGNYTATAESLSNSNYALPAAPYNAFDYKIKQRVVELEWPEVAAFPYSGDIINPILANEHPTLADGETFNATYTYYDQDDVEVDADSLKNAGGYYVVVTPGVTGGQALVDNYIFKPLKWGFVIGESSAAANWPASSDEFVYDGQAHAPVPTISTNVKLQDGYTKVEPVMEYYSVAADGTETLIADSTTIIDAGKYKAKIVKLQATGEDMSPKDLDPESCKIFTGEELVYNILPKDITLQWPRFNTYKYSGTVIKPKVEDPILVGDDTSKWEPTYQYCTSSGTPCDPINAGDYYVNIYPRIDEPGKVSNYSFSPLTWNFSITEASATVNWPVGSDEFTYDGQAHTPKPTIDVHDFNLPDGYTNVEPVMAYYSIADDGTESLISNPKDAGKYKAKIVKLQATGDGETPFDLDPESCKIFTGEELVYNIVPKDIALTWPAQWVYRQDGSVVRPTLAATPELGVDGQSFSGETYKYYTSDGTEITAATEPVNPGAYYVVVEPAVTGTGANVANYNFSPLRFDYSIEEARVQIDWARGAENHEADGNVYRPEPIISHNIPLAEGDTLVPILKYEVLNLLTGDWTEITNPDAPKGAGKFRVSVTGLKIVHGDRSETVVDVPIFGVTPFEYTIRTTEAYAFRVKTSSATTNADEYSLTFYYDNQRIDRILKDPANNTAFLCENTGTDSSDPAWKSTNSNTKNVSFDASFVNARPKSCKSWFCDIKLNKITNLKYLDSSEVETMESMFAAACIENLDLSNLNTSKVTNMCMMFYSYGVGVSSLGANLDLSSFDTKNVLYMNLMFTGANLSNCNVSNFKMDNVEYANNMFEEIKNLESIDLSGCDNIDKIENVRAMFQNSKQLLEIKIPNFKMPNDIDTSFMFNGCCDLKTIYCNYDWNNTSPASELGLFYDKEDNMSLVGGNGTNWSSSHIGKDYAHPDQGTSNPGYFTKAPREPKMNLELQWSKSDEEFDYNGSARTPTAMAYTGDLQDPTDKVVLNATSPYYDWTLYTYYKVEGSTKTKIDNISSLKDPGYYLVEYNPRVVDADGCYVTGDYTFTNTSFQFRIKPVTEAYAFLTKNVTTANADEYSMTFYYDNKRLDRLSSNTGSQAFNCESTTLESYPPWYSYAESVTAVTFDECFKDARPKSCVSWFDGFNNPSLTHINNLDYLNTSEVSSFNDMFYEAKYIKTLDLSNFNTSNAHFMIDMFYGMEGIEFIDCSSFDTSEVEDMQYMFYECSNLTGVNLSSFNTGNVKNFEHMFAESSKLKSLDLSNFVLTSIPKDKDSGGIDSIFADCSSLETLNIQNFDASSRWTAWAFNKCSKLSVIYCDYDWSSSTSTLSVFGDCSSNLKGGNGTTWEASKTGKEFACLDGKNSKTGYFSKPPREGEKPHVKFKWDSLDFVETEEPIKPEASYYECNNLVPGDVIKFKSPDVTYSYYDTDGNPINPVAVGTYRLEFQAKVYDSDGCDVTKYYTFEDNMMTFHITPGPDPIIGNLHVDETALDGTTAISYTYLPVLNDGKKFSDFRISFYSDEACQNPILNSSGNPVDTMKELYQATPAGGSAGTDHYVGPNGTDLYYKIKCSVAHKGGQLDDGVLYTIRVGSKHKFSDIANAQSGVGDYITEYNLKDNLASEEWIGLDWFNSEDYTTRPFGDNGYGPIIIDGNWVALLGRTYGNNVAIHYGGYDGPIFNACSNSVLSCSYSNLDHNTCWVYRFSSGGSYDMWSSYNTNNDCGIIFKRGFSGDSTVSLSSSSSSPISENRPVSLFAKAGSFLGNVFEADESFVEPNEVAAKKSTVTEEQQYVDVKFEAPEDSEFGKLHMECDGVDGGKVEVENCIIDVPLGYTLQYKQNINNTGTIEMKDALGNFYWGCDVWTEGDLPLNSLIIEVDGQKHFLNEAYKFEKAGELKAIASTEVYVELAAAIEEPAALPQTEQSLEGYTGPVTQDAAGNNIMQKAPDAGTTNEYSFNF